METNNEQMVEATAPITTNQNQEKKADGAIQVQSDFFLYLNATTLENLIADLYSREILYQASENYQELKNIGSLVSAIKCLDELCDIEDSIDLILKMCSDYYELETTQVDKIVLKIMADEDEILSFKDYLKKAKDLVTAKRWSE